MVMQTPLLELQSIAPGFSIRWFHNSSNIIMTVTQINIHFNTVLNSFRVTQIHIHLNIILDSLTVQSLWHLMHKVRILRRLKGLSPHFFSQTFWNTETETRKKSFKSVNYSHMNTDCHFHLMYWSVHRRLCMTSPKNGSVTMIWRSV